MRLTKRTVEAARAAERDAFPWDDASGGIDWGNDVLLLSANNSGPGGTFEALFDHACLPVPTGARARLTTLAALRALRRSRSRP